MAQTPLHSSAPCLQRRGGASVVFVAFGAEGPWCEPTSSHVETLGKSVTEEGSRTRNSVATAKLYFKRLLHRGLRTAHKNLMYFNAR